MFLNPFSFDSLCDAMLRTVKSAIDACVTAFNLLDPFSFARVSRRLQNSFLKLIAA